MPKGNLSDYSVGYGKPPKHSQFKPGQSGNPRGRPKKVMAFAEALEKELLAPVTMVEENGRRRKISKLQAILKQHINNAAKGDPKAAALVLNLLKVQPSDASDHLGALLQEFRARHARNMAAESRQHRMIDDEKPSRDGK